jgi:pyruvate-formate lyase-activating enzyme
MAIAINYVSERLKHRLLTQVARWNAAPEGSKERALDAVLETAGMLRENAWRVAQQGTLEGDGVNMDARQWYYEIVGRYRQHQLLPVVP